MTTKQDFGFWLIATSVAANLLDLQTKEIKLVRKDGTCGDISYYFCGETIIIFLNEKKIAEYRNANDFSVLGLRTLKNLCHYINEGKYKVVG